MHTRPASESADRGPSISWLANGVAGAAASCELDSEPISAAAMMHFYCESVSGRSFAFFDQTEIMRRALKVLGQYSELRSQADSVPNLVLMKSLSPLNQTEVHSPSASCSHSRHTADTYDMHSAHITDSQFM